jgi:hypothetical protein
MANSVLVMTALALGGCWGPVIPGEVGARLSGDSLYLRIVPCYEPAKVRVVRLRQDEAIVWEVESVGRPQPREFVVGQTPAGYDEIIPLRDLVPDEEYVVDIEYESGDDEYSVRITFALGDLDSDLWTIGNGDAITEDAFDELKPCD